MDIKDYSRSYEEAFKLSFMERLKMFYYTFMLLITGDFKKYSVAELRANLTAFMSGLSGVSVTYVVKRVSTGDIQHIRLKSVNDHVECYVNGFHLKQTVPVHFAKKYDFYSRIHYVKGCNKPIYVTIMDGEISLSSANPPPQY